MTENVKLIIGKIKGAINKLPFNGFAAKITILAKFAGYANYTVCAVVMVIVITMCSPDGRELENEKSGTLSKKTEKIIKTDHKIADTDVAKYGEFKFKTAVQSNTVSDSTSHGIQVVLRYEPKSDEYAKHLATKFIPSMLQKPVMQPLENGIGFDGSDIEYEGNHKIQWKDDSGKGEEKLWEQKTYRVKKEYDYEYNYGPWTTPIIVFADTIRSLDIEPVLYMNTSSKDSTGGYYIDDKHYSFSYEDYDEAYKNYKNSNEYIKAIRDFVVTGKRERDSYGGNISDWLEWNKYFCEGYTGDDNEHYRYIWQYERSDYDHWYFDHGKQGTEADYKIFGQKYATEGIPTQYETAKKKWDRLVMLYSHSVGQGGYGYDESKLLNYYAELKDKKLDPKSVRWYQGDRTSVSEESDAYKTVVNTNVFIEESRNNLLEDYDYKFKQFFIAHWGDYPDTFKLHRGFEEDFSKKLQSEINEARYWHYSTAELENKKPTDEVFYDYVMEERSSSYVNLSEILEGFAKENGAALQAAYDELVEKTFRDFYNVYLDERTKIFKSLVDLSKCKVYIDYKCLAASNNRETLSAITDKRGVIAYKAQVEPGKWVDAECYFTLLDDTKDYLWQ